MQENKINEIRQKIDAIIDDQNGEDERDKYLSIIERYVIYLQQWMLTHNVMSRRNSLDDIWENVYDSLIVFTMKNAVIYDEICRAKDIVDAGAGGGFPGIPVAIIFPEKKFLLVDVSRKKCSFLRAAKAYLKLSNIAVCQQAIERLEPAKFIISKAAFSPPHVDALARSLVLGGHLLLWTSTNLRDAFARELESYGVRLKDAQVYSCGAHPQRSLLLFIKES